jgi:hypothetical protein
MMNTIGIADTLAQKATNSKGSTLTQRLVRIIKHGSFNSFTSQECAREIMGRNFFGVEEASQHFGFKPSKRELATLAQVPFSAKTLTACKYTHVLVAVFALSVLDIRRKVAAGRELFFCRCFGTSHPDSTHEEPWLSEQAFAKDYGKIGWHLVRKTPVPDSTDLTWWMQQILLGMNEKTPSARVLIYTIVGHYLSTREFLFTDLPHVRCSDRLSLGRGVLVSNWRKGNPYGAGSGIGCNDVSRLSISCLTGVASERKR